MAEVLAYVFSISPSRARGGQAGILPPRDLLSLPTSFPGCLTNGRPSRLQNFLGLFPGNAHPAGAPGPHPDDPGDDGPCCCRPSSWTSFTFNIALAVMVLLVALYPEEAWIFGLSHRPAAVTTLLRLSLNVAHAHRHARGPPVRMPPAKVTSLRPLPGRREFAVGIVVFLILTVINFVVITKGAG